MRIGVNLSNFDFGVSETGIFTTTLHSKNLPNVN
jgi:hypothetical protein